MRPALLRPGCSRRRPTTSPCRPSRCRRATLGKRSCNGAFRIPPSRRRSGAPAACPGSRVRRLARRFLRPCDEPGRCSVAFEFWVFFSFFPLPASDFLQRFLGGKKRKETNKCFLVEEEGKDDVDYFVFLASLYKAQRTGVQYGKSHGSERREARVRPARPGWKCCTLM